MVHSFACLSPEADEEAFFLFASGEWESGCDTSSLMDKPGGQESEDNNAVWGDACRLYATTCESRVHWVRNNQLNVNAHLHLALALQLGWGSKLQVVYQFWTAHPWLKRSDLQEGIPPFGLLLAYSWTRPDRQLVPLEWCDHRYCKWPSAALARRRKLDIPCIIDYLCLHLTLDHVKACDQSRWVLYIIAVYN